jgi:hypothetical protein
VAGGGAPAETRDAGGAVAIVNRDPTPFDAGATLVLHGSAGELLAAATAALGLVSPRRA